MDIQPDLSICVIPALVGADLVPCVESLLANADPVAIEIYLPAGCGLQSQLGQYPEIQFLDYPHDEPGKNVHHVWTQARGRYLAVFYGSMTAGAGSLLAMLEFLDEHPDVGAAAPRIYSATNQLQVNCFRHARISFGAARKMRGWDGRTLCEIDWMSPDVLFVNPVAFQDCSIRHFNGALWARKFCQALRAKGWHQFFVHYSKVICRSTLQVSR